MTSIYVKTKLKTYGNKGCQTAAQQGPSATPTTTANSAYDSFTVIVKITAKSKLLF